ncbi:MAG: stage II sporulation protein R, partial [Ruminococcus sp.]|nr:stage II sporulation protein R [Ruminococcus sp.]
KEHLEDMEKIAEDVLKKNGCDDKVRCEIKKVSFDKRDYGSFSVPAGEYTALQVVIGSGGGHNWWCVMYPPLCVPCAGVDMTDEEILEKYGGELSEEEILLMTESGDFEARFYLAELAQRLAGEIFG